MSVPDVSAYEDNALKRELWHIRKSSRNLTINFPPPRKTTQATRYLKPFAKGTALCGNRLLKTLPRKKRHEQSARNIPTQRWRLLIAAISSDR